MRARLRRKGIELTEDDFNLAYDNNAALKDLTMTDSNFKVTIPDDLSQLNTGVIKQMLSEKESESDSLPTESMGGLLDYLEAEMLASNPDMDRENCEMNCQPRKRAFATSVQVGLRSHAQSPNRHD